jgi:hypothetical protein
MPGASIFHPSQAVAAHGIQPFRNIPPSRNEDRHQGKSLPLVILSGAWTSRSEVHAESKDPYTPETPLSAGEFPLDMRVLSSRTCVIRITQHAAIA